MGKRVTTDINHPDYPHGTSRGHRRVKHNCEPCRQAYRRIQKESDVRCTRGLYSRIPAGEALSVHLRTMLEQGAPVVSPPLIAAAAHLDVKAVRSAADNPAAVISRASVARLMALTIEDVLALATCVDIRPVRQMVVEMNANGHSDVTIAKYAGCAPRAVGHIRAQRTRTIAKDIAEGIKEAHIDLGSTHGDSEEAKRMARRATGIRKPPADAADQRRIYEVRFEILHGIVNEGLTITAAVTQHGRGIVKTMDKPVRSLGLRAGRDPRIGAPISDDTTYLLPTIRDAIADVRYHGHDPVQRWTQLHAECEELTAKRAARAYARTHAQAA